MEVLPLEVQDIIWNLVLMLEWKYKYAGFGSFVNLLRFYYTEDNLDYEGYEKHIKDHGYIYNKYYPTPTRLQCPYICMISL